MTQSPATRRDLKAFEVLVREHHRGVLAYALALSQRPDAADDLAQEAFLVAYRRLDDFDTTRDFGAWVRGILKRKFLESLRASGRHCALTDEVLEGLEHQFARWQLARRETGEDVLATLHDCIGRLEQSFQQAVRRFYLDRAACTRIAAEMATNEVVIRKRLQRARALLHGCLEQKLGPLRLASGNP